MSEFFNTLTDFLLSFNVQLYISVLLVLIAGVKSGMKKRKYFWVKFAFFSPLFLVFTMKRVIGFIYDLLNPFLGVTFALIWLILVFIVWSWFDIDFVTALFLTICGYTMQHILACFDWCLKVWLPFETTKHIAVCGINLVLWVVFYFFVAKRNIGNVLQNENKRLYIIVTAITLIIICFLNYMYYLGGAAGVYLYICETTLAISLMVAQYGIVWLLKTQKEKNIVEYLFIEGEKQQKKTVETVEIINVKYHDLKRQLQAIKDAGTDAVSDEYFKETERAVRDYGVVLKTGNKTLDVLLTQYEFECARREIVFSHFINITDMTTVEKINKTDMYVLLSNALDNAIEAVKHIEPKHRIITLEICDCNGFIKIHLDNYCEVPPKMYNGIPVTTKDDEAYHGYGIKSMRMTARKYNGNLVIGYRDKMFCLDILLQTM